MTFCNATATDCSCRESEKLVESLAIGVPVQIILIISPILTSIVLDAVKIAAIEAFTKVSATYEESAVPVSAEPDPL